MASEVLTQQTMGRGLRLPFGRYTGVGQIDQLDIIAHQSFTELLNAENVLQQFGLEETVAQADRFQVEDSIRKAAAGASGVNTTSSAGESADSDAGTTPAIGTETYADDTEFQTSQPGVVMVGGAAGQRQETPGLGIRAIDSESNPGVDLDLKPVTIERNPKFAKVSYQFPVTTIDVHQPPIELSEISDTDVEQAARRVTSTGEVLLRKEIIAALGKKLRAEERESAEVDSIRIDDEDARDALTKLVMNMPLVPKTKQSVRYVYKLLVPTFMKSVTFRGWTVKSLASARDELSKLVQKYITETLRATREVSTVHPKTLPGSGYTLPLGEKVHDQIDSREQFVRGRVYGGWFKSLFAEESFDSYTGEYVLARLLNISSGIKWWHRLHPQDGAFVYYNSKDRYFPDFVARDSDGVYWIIEGKSERGRDDEQVQAKRKAAESLVRRLIAEDAYADQKWGYLIAYENDTARADSWEDLKAFSQPVSNAL